MKWVILSPYLPQILFKLAEMLTKGSLQYEKDSIWKILQNFEFLLKWNVLKVYSLGSFRSPSHRRKTKNIAKNQISARTTLLRISSNEIPRSQKNQRILVTLSKKTFWGDPN